MNKSTPKIDKVRLALRNEGNFHEENINVYITELQFKLNQVIDAVNSLLDTKKE